MREKSQAERDEEAVELLGDAAALFDPAGALAAEILHEALPKSVWSAVKHNEPKIFLIEVAGSSWWKPMASGLRRLFTEVAVYMPTDLTSSMRDARGASVIIAPTFVIVGDPARLPSELIAGADVRIPVRATPRALRRTLQRLYGKRAVVRQSDFSGLDWPELLVALRPDSTPRACVARWRKTAASLSAPIASDKTPTLDQLAGFGDAMPRLLSLASDIERVRDGRLKKDELPSLLLHGAPGTGKTLVARSLAKTVGLPFIETSIGDWFAGERAHLGTVIGEMRRFFARATSSAPCIAFIDELDGLPDRAKLDEREREWWTPVVTTALVMIDRARAAGSGVVLVGATNHYQFLDPALVRPGRFDIHLEIVGPTTDADFCAILRHHLGPDLTGADLSVIARTALARKATGAVVEAWVKAARERARSKDQSLEFADLVHVAIPAPTRSAAKEMRIAIHEAGHAVVGRVLGGQVKTITLIRTAGVEGMVSFADDDEPATLDILESNIVSGLAGRAADELLNGAAEAGAVADLHRSTGLLAAIHSAFGLRGRLTSHGSVDEAIAAMRFDPKLERKVEADLQRLMRRARQLVALHHRAVKSLARTLVANRVATQEDVDAAILADPAGRAARTWDLIVERVTQDEEEGDASAAGAPTPRQPEAD